MDPELAQEQADSTPPVAVSLEVDGTEEEGTPQEKAGMYLSQKDYMWLRKTNYDQERMKWTKTFVLQHKKYPSKVVELKGASAVHACKFIHWKPQQVRVLEVREDDAKNGKVGKPVPPVMMGSTAVV